MVAPTKGRRAPYDFAIRPILEKLGRGEVDPRLVEAYMRLEYGTLDHLDRATFRRETKIALECIDHDPEAAERLAESYGL